jgi:large subunit ribosomal protein L10
MAAQEKLGKMVKTKMVEEIVFRFNRSSDFVITGYMGSSVSELERLRRSLKKISSSYFVVKNSILKVVFKELGLTQELEKIDGGMGIGLAGDDIASTCREIAAFAKDVQKFKIKGGYIEGKSFSEEKVRQLASLPPRKELLAQVVGGVKAPINGFVYILSGVLRKFVYVVDAIKVSKEKPAATAGQAPSPTA